MAADDSLAAARALADAVAPQALHASLAWHAVVDVAPRRPLGASPLGERWIVPILGGLFWGGSERFAALRGRVLPGGADRQVQRADGTRALRALYEMETDDGHVLTVLNEVTVDDSVQPRYALSHLRVTVAEGPHGWLNRRLFVGTLQSLRPAREAVLVRAHLIE